MGAVHRGIKNAFRNSIRTFSIVLILGLSIGLALTMLLARQAVQTKIDSVKSSIGNTITVSPAGARGFEGGGNPLTSDQMKQVAGTAHVSSVTQVLQDRLQTADTNLISAVDAGSIGRRFSGQNAPQSGSTANPGRGNFTPPVSVLGTNNISGPVLNGGGSVKITQGTSFDATKDENVAVVGTSLATKNNLNVGSTFQAYGATVKVVGVYDAGNTFSNNTVVMPLVTVQKLSQQIGSVSSAIVQVDSITNVSAIQTVIQNELGTSVADVSSQQDTSSQALAPLENIKSISLISLIGSIAAGGVIILLTMMMIVRERRREIGVLKALGAKNIKVMAQFVVESLTLTIMGMAIGIVVGVYASNPITQVLVQNSTGVATQAGSGQGPRGFGRAAIQFVGQGGSSLRNIQTSVGWEILLYGIGAALLIAIIGSAIPAWFISKVRPAEVMRAE